MKFVKLGCLSYKHCGKMYSKCYLGIDTENIKKKVQDSLFRDRLLQF